MLWRLSKDLVSTILDHTKTSSIEVWFYLFLLTTVDFEGGLSIVEMRFRSNFFALVGSESNENLPPNKVHFWDDQKKIIVAALTFKTKVLAVKFRRDK